MVSSTRRTAGCGPACQGVWEGRTGNRLPYPDQCAEQGRKPPSCWIARVRILQFDPVAEGSELPDHSRSACLPRLLSDHWATFVVTNSLMQDQLDQPTLSIGDRPDGLIVSQAHAHE